MVQSPRASCGTRPEMTMTSGRPGITRKTFENSENASSMIPPRYAPRMPKNADSTVASTPTINPICRLPRVAYASWARTSWPVWVVPSRLSPLGGCMPESRMAFGSPTRSGPSSPNRATPTMSTMPVTSHGVMVGRKRRRPPVRRADRAVAMLRVEAPAVSSASAPTVGSVSSWMLVTVVSS